MSKIDRELYEFSKATVLEALKRADWKCERCGKSKKEVGMLYIHHKLAINIAIHQYPEIAPSVIKSICNAKCVCRECHMYEDEESKKNHKFFAQALLGALAMQPALL